MAYWPRDRYPELSPKYSARTRTRLDAADLACDVGNATIPARAATEEQTCAD